MKILIVDDDIVSQVLLTEQLEDLNHDVSVAADGKEGVGNLPGKKSQNCHYRLDDAQRERP